MKTFEVRSALKADLEELVQLEHEAFATDRIALRNWQRLLCSSSATVLVAVTQGHIAGAAVVLTRRTATVARLYSLAVKAAFQGQGLGRILIAAACQHAQQQRCRELRLESRLNNAQAHRLFYALGFQALAQPIADYYADGMAACRFRLALAPPAWLATATGARGSHSSHGSTHPQAGTAAAL